MQILKKKAYRIAGNFRGVKYSLFFSRNFNIGVAYRNVGMKCVFRVERIFYLTKITCYTVFPLINWTLQYILAKA